MDVQEWKSIVEADIPLSIEADAHRKLLINKKTCFSFICQLNTAVQHDCFSAEQLDHIATTLDIN